MSYSIGVVALIFNVEQGNWSWVPLYGSSTLKLYNCNCKQRMSLEPLNEIFGFLDSTFTAVCRTKYFQETRSLIIRGQTARVMTMTSLVLSSLKRIVFSGSFLKDLKGFSSSLSSLGLVECLYCLRLAPLSYTRYWFV